MDFNVLKQLSEQDFLILLDISEDQIITHLNKTALSILPDDSLGKNISSVIIRFSGDHQWDARSGRYHINTRFGIPVSLTLLVTSLDTGYRLYGGMSLQDDLLLQQELLQFRISTSNLNRELHRANVEMKRKARDESLLLRYIAHDLGNIASAISGFSDLLQNESNLDDETEHLYLERIVSNSNQILDLLKDISGLANTTNLPSPVKTDTFDACELVRDSVGTIGSLAAAKNIRLQVSLPQQAFPVTADRPQISRAVTNLLSNAIKFSPLGSVVDVSVFRDEHEILISVTDSGPGIEPSEHDAIFLPMISGKARPTGHESSTGLGLAIVKRITEAYGGHVSVASEPGRGSTFTLRFPAKSA